MNDRRSPWAGSAPGAPFVQDDEGMLTLHFDGAAVQSSMDPAHPVELVLDYSRLMMAALLFVPTPSRIGVIGLGGGSLVKYCHHHLPSASIDVAEISAEVIALRNRFRIPPDDERLRIDRADGAEWIAQLDDAFDLLLVDGFDIGGQASALCTQRFYDDCHAALTPDGLLAINMHADDALHGAYIGRVRASFANSVSVVATEDGVNEIVFAARGDAFRLSEKQLFQRAAALHEALGLDLRRVARPLIDGRRRDFVPAGRAAVRHVMNADD
ncbi:MAG: transferase [Methyloversatilis sp. 12-65-5]|nr:MAG: transferase [Methyloversatilis sp. 12-65-5]